MNAGADDLYILVLGLVLLFKRYFKGQVEFGFATVAGLGYWAINSLGEFTGALTGPDYLMPNAVKVTLKGAVYVTFGFIMDNSMDDLSDVRKMLKWFILAGILGSFTAAGQALYEPLFRVFTLYRPEPWQVQDVRGGGAFLNPNAAGMMIIVFTVFCMSSLGIDGSFGHKPLIGGAVLFLLIALVLTRSRSAWAGFAASIFLLMLFSPLRRYAFLTAIIGAAGYFASEFTQMVLAGRVGEGASSALGRMEIWKIIIRNPSIYILFCGRGVAAEFVRLNATPHNSYLHIAFETGLFGVVWALWFFGRLINSARYLMKSADGFIRSLGIWVVFSLAGLAVCGMALELFFNTFLIYTFFFMAALVHRVRSSITIDGPYTAR
ncbi:MAG: hypothetical protein JXL84_17555 [Deltaproteobacteria bacterium]|nr:hypothetical protein [Deltaproteobacteria bacterium]